MSKKITPVTNWLGYSGNKRKQIEALMKLIPKHTETFVDLFGGTGIVGLNAYHFNRCDRVVYNDLEYDIMLTLKQLHELTGDQVVEGYYKAYRPFGPKPDDRGMVPNAEFKEAYEKMMASYNRERAIAWDIERQADDSEKLLSREQLRGSIRVKHARPDGPQRVAASYLREERVKKLLEEGEDFQDPFQFVFLSKHSFLQTPHLKQNGRVFKETPRLGSKKKPFVNLNKGVEDIREFFDAWHKTPVDFFSHNFTEGWLGMKKHERPRAERMRERWNKMLEELTPKDFVFIDPPYHGSSAGYNAKWKLSMEIYLMAFCQQLDERGIPFLITNNLGWNRTIFIEWTRLPHLHTYLWSEEAVKAIYSGKADKNRYEVYVSNHCFPASKYKLPEGLMEVVLHERTAEELPAEIRFVKKERARTYKSRVKKIAKAESWSLEDLKDEPKSEPKANSKSNNKKKK